MGIWDTLIGRKTHCAGCGTVVPGWRNRKKEEVYCSDACRRNVERISSVPPVSREEARELREVSFYDRVE
ncbi:MAG: hypothetical protein ACOC1F_05080 [Myxococcota bacterium]